MDDDFGVPNDRHAVGHLERRAGGIDHGLVTSFNVAYDVVADPFDVSNDRQGVEAAVASVPAFLCKFVITGHFGYTCHQMGHDGRLGVERLHGPLGAFLVIEDQMRREEEEESTLKLT